jgi:RNA polymerase sigma factor (sigma-70 family)
MSAAQLSKVVGQLRGALVTHEAVGPTEVDLWNRYVLQRDESAFEMLVRRHGPMVLGVCRRVLRHEQDAEDAFQATFLVLVRRAASLRSPQTIANWLHGVARRTALEARTAAAKRRAREAALLPATQETFDPCDDLLPALDQELGRLAEKYRIAVVLCDLEGKTRKEAARQLGWAEGTVASRLARGRGILAKRLAGRGFAGVLVAAALASRAASASVPTSLVISTLTAAGFSAARTAATRGAPSCTVAALTEGVLKSMLFAKLKIAIVVIFVLGIATLSGGALISQSLATESGEQGAEKQQPASRDDWHDRVLELKLQLQQMQDKVARLELETLAPQDRRNGRDDFLSSRFKHRVKFETGVSETKEGGRIEIMEVWGTRPKIEVGGQYLVRGKYVLPRGEHGKLYFYETATGDWGKGFSPTMDLQTVDLDKESGEFTLMHGMGGPGYFHLYLASRDRYSREFANVYFGTGDNVLKDKSW